MSLFRITESVLRQFDGHEWTGFSVPTTICNAIAGSMFFAVAAPLFLETWLSLIVKQSKQSGSGAMKARFEKMKRLNNAFPILAVPTSFVPVTFAVPQILRHIRRSNILTTTANPWGNFL